MINRNFYQHYHLDEAALKVLPAILKRYFPDGCIIGNEFIPKNPTRYDRRPGSFRININTGVWADFATGDTGFGAISLSSYLFKISRHEAARRVASMLGKRYGP